MELNKRQPNPKFHFEANIGKMMNHGTLMPYKDYDIMTFFPCVSSMVDYSSFLQKKNSYQYRPAPVVWGFVWLGHRGRLILKREGMKTISLWP